MAVNTDRESALARKYLFLIKKLPISTMLKKDIVEEILDFQPDDGDIMIATFPKTGTTWVQYIVQQILSGGKSFPTINDLLEKEMPFLEMVGVASIRKLTTKPRVYKLHLPYNMMKKNFKSKVIYVYRRPEDVVVSYYHFLNNLNQSVNFDEFFEDFLNGEVSFGSYFQHVVSYLRHKNEENLLLVSYEKLHSDRKAEILRIAKFLGNFFYDGLVVDEFLLNEIIEHTSFNFMKKNLSLYFPVDPKKDSLTSDGPKTAVTFFRKGIIGDGKNYLNKDQVGKLKKLAEEIINDSTILQEWYET